MSMFMSAVNKRRRPVPYEFPKKPPYNAPIPMRVPTPDRTGSTVHASVLDFGDNWFGGARYWLGHTPYYNVNEDIEDPCIACSHNGFDWFEPEGLTNPLAFKPPGDANNSDIDIEFDPDTGLMHVWWRESKRDLDPRYTAILHSSSGDGSIWAEPDMVRQVWGETTGVQLISPSIVRVAAGNWVMYTGENAVPSMCTATSPDGPWSESVPVGGGAAWVAWHFDMILHEGVYYGLVATADYKMRTISSADGVNWTASPGHVMVSSGTGWDHQLYRGSLTPHEDGEHFRVWYSAHGPWHEPAGRHFRMGYTLIPKSEWPDP